MSSIEFWDNKYAGERKNLPHSSYAEEKEKLFPRGSVVCDIGGGQGNDALYFLQQGHSVILVDGSEVAIREAEKRVASEGLEKNFTAILADISKGIPLESESVDVVYARSALHFFDKETTVRILKEICRVLKLGGAAHIGVKSPEHVYRGEQELAWLKENAEELEPNVFRTEGRIVSRFSHEQWKEILGNAGVQTFTIEDREEDISHETKDPELAKIPLLTTDVSFRKG